MTPKAKEFLTKLADLMEEYGVEVSSYTDYDGCKEISFEIYHGEDNSGRSYIEEHTCHDSWFRAEELRRMIGNENE